MEKKSQSLEELVRYNQSQFEHFTQLPFNTLVRGDVLKDDSKRQVFLACIQRFSSNFQTIMLTRQALCSDPRYQSVFRDHLREEIDHDALIAARPGAKEIEDPLFIAASSWFSYQMIVLDNAEKTALVHLVLETAGDHFHTLAAQTLSEHVPTGYFETHAELDEGHAALGESLLAGLSAPIYERLHEVVRLGWSMIGAAAERVVILVDAA